MKKVAVLGAGMVGRAIARDLAEYCQVSSIDISPENLDKLKLYMNIKTQQQDLTNRENIKNSIQNADLVVNAVPGFMGFNTLKSIIQSGKNVVDIAFSPEDPFALDELARQRGVIAVTDCGVAPGISNMILGYHHQAMQVDSFVCLVGGLPLTRTWPFQYKAPFSPSDVLEEYTRPARYKENNYLVTRPALSDPEHIEFPEIGTLVAFNSDGLRTLLKTIDIPDMKEKTLRYPGHIELMQVFRDTGFFSTDPIEINGTLIKPLDLTSKLLFKSWELADDEPEFTVMKITVKGKEKGEPVTHIYDLLDKYDQKSGVSSMARTTGYACTAAVKLILDQKFTRQGISPPEYVGAETDCLSAAFSYMKDRNIIYEHKILKGNP